MKPNDLRLNDLTMANIFFFLNHEKYELWPLPEQKSRLLHRKLENVAAIHTIALP